MPKIYCNYVAHFVEITNKYRELVCFDGFNLYDLINFLNKQYKGFQEELIDVDSKELLSKNGVLLMRGEESTRGISRLDTELQDGDTLTIF